MSLKIFSLTFRLFSVLSQLIGALLPDSGKCARFYFRFCCPGVEGVDPFSVDWVGENNWLVPPIYLISYK